MGLDGIVLGADPAPAVEGPGGGVPGSSLKEREERLVGLIGAGGLGEEAVEELDGLGLGDIRQIKS